VVKAKKRASPKRAARAKPAKSPRRAKPAKSAKPLKSAKSRKSPKPAKPAKKPSSEIPPVLAPVADAFAAVPGVSRRRMFSSENAFSVNGKIFAMLTRGLFVVKLPKERVDDLVDAGKGQRFDSGQGRLMKEWIAVEAGALPWVALAKEAHSYVRRGGR
jgi:TfoX/Sxy family transcriptional regulator of competence genes